MSTAITSFCSYKLEKLNLGTARRFQSSDHNKTRCVTWTGTGKHGCCYSARKHVYSFSRNRLGRGQSKRPRMMDVNAANNLSPVPPSPSGPSSSEWSKWLLLILLPIILPFIKFKPGSSILIRKQMDTRLELVETMAEKIEEVAIKVDKFADILVEKLPEGSKLRKAIEMLDEVAEQTIKAADCVEELVQKVEDFQNTMEKAIKEQSNDDGAENVKVVEPEDMEEEKKKKEP